MDELSPRASSRRRAFQLRRLPERLSALWTTAALGVSFVVVFLVGFGVALWTGGHAGSPFQVFEIHLGGTEGRINGLLLAVTTLFSLAMVLQSRRIVQRLAASEARAMEVAGRDVLSGLPNRFLFNELIHTEQARCQRKSSLFALFYVDIDHFKQINDKYGHGAGDQMIVAVTRRIAKALRTCDSIARLGGDEFAILQSDVQEPRDCAALATRIIEAMGEPFALEGAQVFSSVSIGIAIYPTNGRNRESLFRVADLALYRAKREGRNRFAFFEPKMGEELRLRQHAEDELRCAIERDELTLVYQPIMSAPNGRMVGVEALVRWQHKTQGLLTADHFISLAENRGLIVPLGAWVLRQACVDAERWPNLYVAVNVSPVQFRQKDFVASVQRILTDTGVKPNRIELELTEGVIISDADQAEKLIIDLRALGIRMALDEFGNGYSSLIYLRRFAFDKIKIDRSFLESMEPAGESAIIVESIVKLGQALGLTVTAEGIESEDQVRFLRNLGCDELQGFYYSAPLSREELDSKYAALTQAPWLADVAAVSRAG
ncbi:MAG: putative bifunctional diguanylate cyclase/phosphodiesterase [Beijerinckiaceae bacterium]